jgi:hypothetical protein
MSQHYPRIRVLTKDGYMLIREGLSFTFYMDHPHVELAPRVLGALEEYLRALGPQALRYFSDEEDSWKKFDEAGQAIIRNELLDPRQTRVLIVDASVYEHRYRFEYHGKPLSVPPPFDLSTAVSAASFWLPTEFLEEHGPERTRALALSLASHLPFCSGHAGLSFNCETDLIGVERQLLKWCFRHPGMDIPDVDSLSWKIGTRARGPAWLTFLGQPLLGELGGSAALRARLLSPGASVQELEGERAVVTLGPWPEAGDTEQGDNLPAYRELARVLEPWLYQEANLSVSSFSPEELLRWQRRFLD